jgi:urea-proton symporter
MGIAGTIFFYIGVSMGWLYTFMGVLLGSAVVPIGRQPSFIFADILN